MKKIANLSLLLLLCALTAFGQASVPTVSTPVIYCQGATASALTATAGSSTDTLYWYTVPTGGTGTKIAPTPSTSVAGTTSYYVSAKPETGAESARDTIDVIVNPFAVTPVAPSPVIYCQNAAAVALTATKASSDTLLWYTVATGGTGSRTAPTPLTTTAGTTSYYVSAKTAAGCEGARDTVDVIINPVAVTPVAPSKVTYCLNATAVALTATKASTDTLFWYTVATGGTGSRTAPTPLTTTAGTTSYYVSAKTAAGCEGARDTTDVIINPLAVTPVAPSPVTYCQNATAVALTATKASSDTLLWYTVATGGTGSKTAPIPLTTTAGTTTYYVSAKTAAGCEGLRDTVDVIVNPMAGKPSVTTPVAYCQSLPAVPLSATAASSTDTLLWYTVATGGTGSKTAPTPPTAVAGSTFFYVSGKTDQGCEGVRDSIKVIINPLAAKPTAPTPVAYCINATAIPLTATAGSSSDTLLWYTTATGGTGSKTAPTPSTSTAGTTSFYVSGKTSIGCEGERDTIKVIINPLAVTPVAPSPVTYCQNATAVALTATKASSDTLFWYTVPTGGTGSKTAPTPLTTTVGTTSYYVSAKTAAGCEGLRDTVDVIINPLAVKPTVTTPVAYCQSLPAIPLSATASGTDTLVWYTVATGGTGSKTAPTPSTAITGTTYFYVNGKTDKGCEGPRDSIKVTINPLAARPTGPTPVSYCINATAIPLTATAGSSSDTLFWYTTATGGVGSKTAPTPSTSATGTTSFYVSGKTSLGCEGERTTISVVINPLAAKPTVTTPVRYCQASTAVALTATKGTSSDTLLWYTVATGGTGSKTAPTPSTVSAGTTTYYVSAKSSAGCEGLRDSIKVLVNPKPDTPAIITPVRYCQGVPAVILSATAGSSSDTLLWYTASTGGTGSKTAPVPSTVTPGTTVYYVSAKTAANCESARKGISVIVDAYAATPVVSSPVVYCQNATAVPLTATKGSGSDTLFWYTTATGGTGSKTALTPSTTAAGSTYYYVSAKGSNGCEGIRARITTYINPAIPAFNIKTADSMLCLGDTTKLMAGLGEANTLNAPVIDDNKGSGIMFDVVAKRGINITGFEVNTEVVSGEPFNIYYKTGSLTGFETTAASWTFVGSVMLSGSTGVLSVPLPVNVTIPAGQKAAFYLTNTGTANVHYNNGTGSAAAYVEDDNIQIFEGKGKSFPFGTTSANRRFEGKIKYNALTIDWSTGSTMDTISVSPAIDTKYWAKIANSEGCTAVDTIQVEVSPIPSAPVAISPVKFCERRPAVPLTATAGATDTLIWYTTATGGTGSKTAPTPSTSVVGTTFYYVSAKSNKGCEGLRDTVEVIINPAADTPEAVSPIIYCQNATAVPLTALAGSPTDTLIWYTTGTGGTGSKTAPTPSTTTAGTTSFYVSGKSNIGCEGARDTVKVTVNPGGSTPTVTSPVRYCRGATAIPLTATKGSSSDTLIWYTTATGGTGDRTAPTPSTAANGTTNYYVSAKTALGCEGARATIQVIVSTAGMPTAPTPVMYCKSATAVPLTATAANPADTLFWYTTPTGGTGSKTAPTPSTAVAGTTFYYVSGKTSAGCEGDRDTIKVMINPPGGTPVVSSPVTYCQFATAIPLTATPIGDVDTLLWYTAATGGTGSTLAPTPSTTAAGTTNYYVSAKTDYGCEGSRATLQVVINPVAANPTVSTPVNYCLGATAVALTATKASSTDTLLWYTTATGGTGSKTAPTPTTATLGTTTYYVSGKTNKGCEGQRDSIKVVVNPLAATPDAPTPIIYCQGSTAAPLTAIPGNPADTLIWYTTATGGTGSKTAPTPSTATAGTTFYYVSGKTNKGCEGKRDTTEVIIRAAAAPTVSTPVKYCQNATPVALTATAASPSDTLYWYTTATGGTGTTTAPTPSTATVGTTPYYVSSKLTNGCESARKLINVQINPPATTPVAPSPVKYCLGATATALTATKGSTTDTLFWYTVPVGGTGSKTAPTPTTTATGTTFYYVGSNTAEGCMGSLRDTIEVIVNPVPADPTVITPVTYCQNATATALTATAASTADTLYWYTAATGGTGSITTPIPSTSTAGSFARYVVGRNTVGCESNRIKIDITINPKGATPTVTTPVQYCKGEPTVALTATKGSSSDTLLWYTVSTGGTDSRTAPTPSSATAGTTSYYVSAKTNLGCEGDRATINVQINPTADTPGVTTPVVYCQKDKAFALTATKGASSDILLWYTAPTGGTGSTTAPIPSTATPGTTLYYVSGKTSFGCESGRDTIVVIVNPEPVVTVSSLASTGIIHCRNVDSVLVKATAPTAVAYQWYYEMGLVSGAVYDTVHARGTGYWAALVTDAKGCRNKDSIWIQRDTLEEPILSPSESKICMGNSILLTCSPGFSTNRFKWFHNDIYLSSIPLTVNTVTASDTGTYYVDMSNAVGCTYRTNDARVDFYPLTPKPTLVYTPPVLSITGGTYRAFQWYQDTKWIFGATGNTYTVTSKGKYYVEVTDANGCTSNSDTIDIQKLVGIQPEYADMKMRLYPNPTHTSVTIEAPIKVNVIVTDIAGKTLLSIKDATTVDLANFADGSYFFRITDENGQTLGTEKINKVSAP